MEYKILLIMVAIILGGGITGSAFAEKSPYESGFSHAEDDCKLAKQDRAQDMYILESDKGPAYHTQAFMDGYYDGWYDSGCVKQDLNHMLYDGDEEVNTGIENSFNNRDSVVQPQSQQATTVQSNQCPSQIINGDCIVGQEQKTHNEFAQANRAEN